MNRRMGVVGCLAWLIVAGQMMADEVSRNGSGSDVSVPPRTNIIYINADDLGVMDVGFQSDRYHTPNLDQLRADGMLFTNAYAPAANCAPSRACVFSGQYGPRHGVYTVDSSARGKSKHRRLVPIKNTKFLPSDQLTIAEVFQDAGYRTIHLGKWHVGSDPTTEGFDINIGGDGGGSPSGGGYFSPYSGGPMKRFSDQYPPGTHRVDIFADQAVKFLNESRNEPFFMHLAFYSVHTRIEPVPEFVERYKGKNVDAAYASMVEKMDQGIGKILDELDKLGLAERTFVLFTSDNGGVRAISDQAPFRSGKGSYFEGGIREPLVARWSGQIAAGSTSDVSVIGLDFFPTFLEVAGIPAPSSKVLDGVSLVPLLKQTGTIPDRTLFWHFPIYLQAYSGAGDDSHDPRFRTRPGSALRSGRWKLHEYFEDGRLELYDLQTDIGERHDLSASMPERTEQLHSRLKQWRESVDAPVPAQPNPDYAETTSAP
ncbi:sulfatase [Neorhodopirellula pilleata]|uniref:Arylsulfatase n=1 Tax=Neorhodopirellula pilleata TaxID=2714738 RepID=A0A5C5ZPW1_9BACT|nr:sulfatase [Neorhodopirellula pilleata]TWT89175.1 Arylsulfatase [Neorhodopirellula pilleata]